MIQPDCDPTGFTYDDAAGDIAVSAAFGSWTRIRRTSVEELAIAITSGKLRRGGETVEVAPCVARIAFGGRSTGGAPVVADCVPRQATALLDAMLAHALQSWLQERSDLVQAHRTAPSRGRLETVGEMTADTFGWDTVFALHIGEVNAAIARAGTSPKSFEAADAADGYAMKGGFGTWSIEPGGDGDLIRLTVPFVDTSFSRPDGSSERVAGACRVQVRLDFVQHVGSYRQLKVRSTPVSSGAKVAAVVGTTFDGTPPSFIVQVMAGALVEQWLNRNISSFDHVFATVELNRSADRGAFQWLQPTDHAYAYSDLDHGEGALGVLCTTGPRSSIGLMQQLSGAALPPGAKTAFMVSAQRLVDQMMLPAMPQTFKGSHAGDFKVSSSGDSVVNASQSASFTVTQGGKDYDAQVTDLTFAVAGEELLFDVTTQTEISPGIVAICRTQSFIGIELVDRPDGSQILNYVDRRPSIQDRWTKADPRIALTEEILGIIVAVLTLIGTVVTGGAAIGALGLVVGFAAGLIAVTTTILQDVDLDNAPSIGAAVLDATASTAWADKKDFDLITACLNGSLQLCGTFK